MTTAEHERFQNLVEDHKKILYKICHSYCRNPGDRDDLAQEIIVQLWRSFGTFNGRVRFSTWMYRIALNVAISFYRRESVRTRHVVPGSEHCWRRSMNPEPGQKKSRFYISGSMNWIPSARRS
jgi:RNA polymerase sigma factor (sigma-70 family)